MCVCVLAIGKCAMHMIFHVHVHVYVHMYGLIAAQCEGIEYSSRETQVSNKGSLTCKGSTPH